MPADASRPTLDGHVVASSLPSSSGMGLYGARRDRVRAQGAAATNDELMTWLAVAAVFGVFARLNYFLYPSVYTDWVYFGDFFRLAFYVAILFAAVQEIRSYWEKVSQTAVLEERAASPATSTTGWPRSSPSSAGIVRSLDADDPTVARVSASAARALSESGSRSPR